MKKLMKMITNLNSQMKLSTHLELKKDLLKMMETQGLMRGITNLREIRKIPRIQRLKR